jgi:hypothetical protein
MQRTPNPMKTPATTGDIQCIESVKPVHANLSEMLVFKLEVVLFVNELTKTIRPETRMHPVWEGRAAILAPAYHRWPPTF